MCFLWLYHDTNSSFLFFVLFLVLVFVSLLILLHSYNDESKVMKNFGNLLVLFFSSQKWRPSIRSYNRHRVALSEYTSLLVRWIHVDISSCPSKRRTSLLKFPPPLCCWSVLGARRVLWIGTKIIQKVWSGLNAGRSITSIYLSSLSLFPKVRYMQILQSFWLTLALVQTFASRYLFF